MFLQRDPIGFEGGQLGLYSYVSNDPFSWVDPSGFSSAEAGLFMGAGTGSAMTSSYGTFSGVTSVVGRILNLLKTASKISLPTTVVGSSAPDMPPPGNCSKDFVRKIRKLVKDIEQRGTSCKGLAPMDIVGRSLQAGKASKALFWRSFLANICFNGGNSGHREAIDNLRRGIHACFNVQ